MRVRRGGARPAGRAVRGGRVRAAVGEGEQDLAGGEPGHALGDRPRPTPTGRRGQTIDRLAGASARRPAASSRAAAEDERPRSPGSATQTERCGDVVAVDEHVGEQCRPPARRWWSRRRGRGRGRPARRRGRRARQPCRRPRRGRRGGRGHAWRLVEAGGVEGGGVGRGGAAAAVGRYAAHDGEHVRGRVAQVQPDRTARRRRRGRRMSEQPDEPPERGVQSGQHVVPFHHDTLRDTPG